MFRIIGAGLQLVAVALVGLNYSLEVLGLYGMFWATAMIFRVAGAWGLDLTGLKTQSVLWHQGETSAARAYATRDSFTLAIVWSGLAVLGVVGISLGAFFLGYSPSFPLILVMVAAISAMQKLWTNQMRAAERIQIGQLLESVALPASGIALIFASIWFPQLDLLWGQLIALCIILVMFYLFNPLRPVTRRQRYDLSPQPWKEAIALGASTFLSALSSRIGIFFTGFGALSSAGIYEIAQRIQSVSALTINSVATVFLPAIRVEAVTGTPRRLKVLLLRGTLLSFAPPALILVLHLIAGEWALSLVFNDSMPTLWLSCTLLLGAAALNGATGILSNLLAMTGRGRTFAVIALLQLILLVAGICIEADFNEVTVAKWVLLSEAVRSLLLVAVSMPQLIQRYR